MSILGWQAKFMCVACFLGVAVRWDAIGGAWHRWAVREVQLVVQCNRWCGAIGGAWRRWAVEEVWSFAALVQGQIICALMERR